MSYVRTIATPPGARVPLRLAGVAAVVALYFLGFFLHVFLRGIADDLGRPIGSASPIESLLFSGNPSMWLQRWTPDVAAIQWLAVLIHASWFFLPPLIVAFVAIRCGAARAAQLVLLQMCLFYSADVFCALFPTRPPWMDYDVTRLINVVYSDHAASDSNAVASVPSLHVALPMLYALWFARQPDSLLQKLAPCFAAWTLAMTWAVVYGGEHYVVGAMVGACWAAVVWAIAIAPCASMRAMLAGRLRLRRTGALRPNMPFDALPEA